MERVTLNGTDLNVSRVCLGCWQFNNDKTTINWESQSMQQSKAIVDRCFEVGINFFDTAQGYAGSEEVLGECLQGRRKDAIVATKYGFGKGTEPYTAEDIDKTVTTALTKLQTDYIDLLQIHFPCFIKDAAETITELKRQVSLGRIRYYGVSNFGPKNLHTYLDAGLAPVSNQMGYNLLWRSVEFDVQPICKDKGIGILAYSPLQQGLLSGRYEKLEDLPEGRRRGKLFASQGLARHGQDGCEAEVFEAVRNIKSICKRENLDMAKASLAWVLQQEAVPVAIVGARTPEQVTENSQIIKLTHAVVKELSDATEKVKQKVGRSLDQWVHPDRCE
ncbi:hypothetical protein LOTGIDRAFT_237410 [Lottia gigantea]|uniref:NADP-dependent oxidoreductase domain-containing protein n=1 Tax=Lottia gigantea TaxID=225164 RepID=V4CPE7_LOTGI|nr:hypothetical protein LOTGIDRAFT_237410 [Lottia gigantea]ESP04305.1 hypothetical protein LOTGIDRAFT_237410 [Lottia gigantea]